MDTASGRPRDWIRDERGEREQLLGLARPRRGLLPLDAATVDARLEVEEARGFVVPRIARRDAAHRRARIAMARRAARCCAPAGAFHSFSPLSTHSKPGFATSSACIARTSAPANAMPERKLARAAARAPARRPRRRRAPPARRAREPRGACATSDDGHRGAGRCRAPLSSIHSNVSSPDSRAVTKKRR